MADRKEYIMREEQYEGLPGGSVHEAVQQCFADYFASDKRHKVSITVNDVTVTMQRKYF